MIESEELRKKGDEGEALTIVSASRIGLSADMLVLLLSAGPFGQAAGFEGCPHIANTRANCCRRWSVFGERVGRQRIGPTGRRRER